MRVLLILLAGLAVASAIGAVHRASAQRPVAHVTGGGIGTVEDVPFSQFGFGVVVTEFGAEGGARGHFNCLMAGRTAVDDLALMSVVGRVSWADDNGDGSVTFGGVGTVNLGELGRLTNVEFKVTVTDGGVGTGMLELTVDGGGALAGFGFPDPLELPVETVGSGRIKIH